MQQDSANKKQYSVFSQKEKGLPVFMKAWYLDTVCDGGNWDVVIEKEGEEIIASLVYFQKQKLGLRYLTMPPFVKVMGPYIKPAYRSLKESHRLLEKLIGQLPKVDCIKQDLHYSNANWLPFNWAGFQQTSRYTYLLELDDLDAVFKNINRNMRRNIKKAQSQLIVKRDLPLETFYEINKMSFDRQGIGIPYSFEQLKKHDEALASHKARQIFYAEDQNGQIHSAAYLIWDEYSSYYHLSGDNPSLRQSGAGILLIWEAIQFTKNELGLNIFDFEGSMIKPVEQIRRQFGAKQQPYSRVWKYNSKLYYLLDLLQGKAW